MKIRVSNILDDLEMAGEEELRNDLAAFSCNQNKEIEIFLKEKAIDFAKRKLSITYLVNDEEDGEILGYFTLTHKSIVADGKNLSKKAKRKLERYSRKDGKTGNYMASAFLLAQFGKNFSVENGKRISGAELMDFVDYVLYDVQRRIGGGIIYLDCEDEQKLIDFYIGQNFKRFDDRFSEEEEKEYIQFMRFF